MVGGSLQAIFQGLKVTMLYHHQPMTFRTAPEAFPFLPYRRQIKTGRGMQGHLWTQHISLLTFLWLECSYLAMLKCKQDRETRASCTSRKGGIWVPSSATTSLPFGSWNNVFQSVYQSVRLIVHSEVALGFFPRWGRCPNTF